MAKIANDRIVSAGRDGAVKIWQIDRETDGINEVLSYREHDGFVNSVAFIPETLEFPQGKAGEI